VPDIFTGDENLGMAGDVAQMSLHFFKDVDVHDGIDYGTRTIRGVKQPIALNGWAFGGSNSTNFNVNLVRRTETEFYHNATNTNDTSLKGRHGQVKSYTEYVISPSGEESKTNRLNIEYYMPTNLEDGQERRVPWESFPKILLVKPIS
jgi:hypothetical protein